MDRPAYKTEPREDLEMRCEILTKLLYKTAIAGEKEDCGCQAIAELVDMLDKFQEIAIENGLNPTDWREAYGS